MTPIEDNKELVALLLNRDLEERAGRLLRIEDVAEFMDVSKQTVYRLIRAGSLRALRIGRLIRIRPADLKDYLEKAEEEYEGQ